MNDIFIILTACLVAINCALLGSFLLLRKMAMVGDAISHAVLPGIVLAYYFAEEKGSVYLLVGATLSGLAATFLIDLIARKIRIQGDAAIGITYTFLFAVGMILLALLMQGNADIDQECVLYGDIAMINFDKVIIDQNLFIGPRAMYTELIAFVIVFGTILVGYKGFKLLSFNEDFAKSIGIKTGRWHYYLMGLVALTTVVSFEVVGAVLVVGFLIIPAATAQLITRKLGQLIFLACVLGIFAVISGYFFATALNVSLTGSMVLMSGVLFAIVFALVRTRQRIQVLRSLVNPAFKASGQEKGGTL